MNLRYGNIPELYNFNFNESAASTEEISTSTEEQAALESVTLRTRELSDMSSKRYELINEFKL